MLYNNTLVFILLFLFVVIAIDIIPQWYTWQSRIYIGRYANREIWTEKVMRKAIQWLKNTPTIQLTDNKRLIIIDILKGNYKRTAIQHWQKAALILGLTECYKKTKNTLCRKEVDAFLKSNFPNGNWREKPTEIDGVILAYAILNIPWINHDNYKSVYDTAYQLVQDLVGTDGTVAYRKYTTDYRFVDTIGFICPFLVLYGVKFNKPEAIDLSIKQITTFNENGLLSNTNIPCHTYNIKTNLPVGLFGWGRGMGWYAIGLIDAWSILPSENSYKKVLELSVISFAKTAITFQNENGSWSWIVLDKSARMDSSTTATLAWFLANASSIESISTICIPAKEKALEYLKSVTRRDGAIDFSQGDTKAIGIHSNEFDILPFTQGFCLRTIYYN
ncbi:glycoside hydrolase family 88 protein [Flavobacterium sp.]|jgi:unsaturated rhamnogalacturonyl hydrolase|uniref:glycoside hydrolase family 88 protein n=1 Tax=Flavobacterium sp. TaxID=239 RepID=UPI0037BEE82F